MKRCVLFFLAVLVCMTAIARKPGYADYKPLSAFGGDTVAYLDYNWGIQAMGTNSNAPLQQFFDRFELPIRSVDFTCVNGYVLASVRFYIIPYDSVAKLKEERAVLLNKCSLFSMYVYPWEVENSEDLPDYETIHRSIPELKEKGTVLLPWKEEYKEVIGRYLVQDVQFNWDENDEKRLK
ncbi:hypothetical protein [uncultured Alistipes sp.]|uniref:hypothetical protein n=1 Tax=uncultured Alistipes sp. TaxID=538949 RepID=UPI0025E44083|nr:hypothetical protein [uncultured Alistipes sp.]